MNRARRRCAQLLFALLAATLLTFAVTSATALAADESDEDHSEEAPHGDEELSGFGTGDWDGLIVAAGAGLVFAAITFSMSSPGEIHRAGDHH